MKINVDQLKQIKGWLSFLADYYIDLVGDDAYLSVDEYEGLPDEMEIEELCLSFPDDQEYYDISLEDFCCYMSEIETLRKDGDYIVRTDHIIQVVISSKRMGFTSFEDKMQSIIVKGEGVEASVIKSPFLVGVMNAKDGRYEKDFGIGSCEYYTAIEIKLKEDWDDAKINALVEQMCFYLTVKMGVAIYPWEGPDLNDIYDSMNDYFDDEEENVSEDVQFEIEQSALPAYSPLLKMFRQAKGVEDAEIQFLQYYKVIEYVSPLVAKSVAYERLNKRLDLLPSVARDSNFLDSILLVARKYDTDMRDDSLAVAVIENCVDVIPLFELFPVRLRKKMKSNLKLHQDALKDNDVTEEQVRSLQKQIAAILYATRNSIVHAKSNYEITGNEISTEELGEANQIMEIIAHSIINWNQRQPEGFRS